MKPKTFALAAMASLCLVGTAAQANLTVIDISGHVTGGSGGLPNDVISATLGANAHVIGWTYDVQLETFGASWANEASFQITDSAVTAGISGLNTNTVQTQAPGAIINYIGGDDFVALALDFSIGADGILLVELQESFDDGVPGGDGFWHAGSTITIEWTPIPTPGALALLGLAGLATRRRRRA